LKNSRSPKQFHESLCANEKNVDKIVSDYSRNGLIMTSSKKEKKKPAFKKIEDGMIFEIEGNIIAVGFPIEVERKYAGEGKIGITGGGAGGEKYSKTKYHWNYISPNPLPVGDMKTLNRMIQSASGTLVASSSNACSITLKMPDNDSIIDMLKPHPIVECKTCKAINPKSNKFCSNCGNPLAV